jgi:hypothetical protein
MGSHACGDDVSHVIRNAIIEKSRIPSLLGWVVQNWNANKDEPKINLRKIISR